MEKTLGLDIWKQSFWLSVIFGINASQRVCVVDGFSMNPTLQNGEYILVNKLAYKTGKRNAAHRGIHVPMNLEEDLIKG